MRPIRMLDWDAVQKDKINRIKVPVPFTAYTSDDGFYRVDIPGPLIKQHDEVQVLDRRQFADMANGSYYLVTRVKTHAAFLGQSEEEVLKTGQPVL
ncbi:MAG: hypothetical protein IPI66_15745 [Chitinophagaceae bacterium]|nr:hypothetical protein [Chitinophagaceae bacterium]